MSYSFNCPFCGNKLQSEESWTGMETTCPNCQNKFQIPPAAGAPQQIKLIPVAPGANPQQQSEGQINDIEWLRSLNLDNIEKKIKLCFKGFFACWVASIIAILPMIIGIALVIPALAQGHSANNDSFSIIPFIGLIFIFIFFLLLIVAVILNITIYYIHHYYVWQLLPPQSRPAGPLATVLLLLVPLFSIYWNFKSIGDQSKLIENELGPKAKGTVITAYGICFLNIASIVLIVLSPFVALLGLIPYFGMAVQLIVRLLSSMFNLLNLVFSITWFIMVHNNAMALINLRKQSQSQL